MTAALARPPDDALLCLRRSTPHERRQRAPTAQSRCLSLSAVAVSRQSAVDVVQDVPVLLQRFDQPRVSEVLHYARRCLQSPEADPLAVRGDLGSVGDVGGADHLPDRAGVVLGFARTEPAIAGESLDLPVLAVAPAKQ